ncbi:helix-turn-helix transcriptional regulator [Niastella sp. OAS944]|uniref:helix-turn-helix transcriptional regulator n=1 Tax=Niastella sp. OAS944 TaxID=2664089 RepID=UPI0034859236|nr:putative ArsR family transcriptional regulator [Chitinophagaceae bacterium OAS944]
MKQSASDRILFLLKQRGEASAAVIAEALSMTKEGARQHLVKLAELGLVDTVIKSSGVGRPNTSYLLTDKGIEKFPNTHADLTVQLLQSVKNLLGNDALDTLIKDREQQTYQRYKQAMEAAHTLPERVAALAAIREQEGYMAEWSRDGDSYLLIENHCPICAAATECQGFCNAELNNFRQLLGKEYSVERTEHLLSGARRCAYRISSTAL